MNALATHPQVSDRDGDAPELTRAPIPPARSTAAAGRVAGTVMIPVLPRLHDVLDPRDLVADELVPWRASGYDVSSLE